MSSTCSNLVIKDLSSFEEYPKSDNALWTEIFKIPVAYKFPIAITFKKRSKSYRHPRKIQAISQVDFETNIKIGEISSFQSNTGWKNVFHITKYPMKITLHYLTALIRCKKRMLRRRRI